MRDNSFYSRSGSKAKSSKNSRYFLRLLRNNTYFYLLYWIAVPNQKEGILSLWNEFFCILEIIIYVIYFLYFVLMYHDVPRANNVPH